MNDVTTTKMTSDDATADAPTPDDAPSDTDGLARGADAWYDLRQYTSARLALGRAGNAQRTRDVLAFGYAHAQARDAVHVPLDAAALAQALHADGHTVIHVQSAAPDRATYLLRPDLGRRLDDASARQLDALAAQSTGCDLLLVVGDGLSAMGIAQQASALVRAIAARAGGLTLGPIIVARQARVALGDEIGERLGARAVAMLIGERPGLSSPDSVGIYLTHAPRVGCTDAARNCISNIRPQGLAADEAAHKLVWLTQQARVLGATGVALKDESGAAPVAGINPPSRAGDTTP